MQVRCLVFAQVGRRQVTCIGRLTMLLTIFRTQNQLVRCSSPSRRFKPFTFRTITMDSQDKPDDSLADVNEAS